MQIENAVLRVEATAEGAELSSIWNKETGTEYLWQADPKWWKRRAPILFPFVGRCKDYQYRAKGKVYHMPQHGFTRDREFDIAESSDQSMTFRMCSDDRTRAMYPWEFCLLVTYSLEGNTLQTAYAVENRDGEDMYFSIGAHPGFAFLKDYQAPYLEFSEKETLDRLILQPESGLFSSNVQSGYLTGEDRIPITKELFAQDALVFKGIRSQSISLRDRASEHGVTVDLAGFPYLGLWAAPGAPYVCIEPWYGLADYEDFEGDVSEKAGIQRLTPGDTFHCRFAVHII